MQTQSSFHDIYIPKTPIVIFTYFLIFFLYLQIFPYPYVYSDEYNDFYFPEKTTQQILNNVTDAMIQITVQDENGDVNETGSGYLIDNRRGYVLTARHVVKLFIEKKNAKIIGKAIGEPQEEISLKYYDSADDDLDVALLQIDPPDKLINKQPIEIGLVIPPNHSDVIILGFQYGDEYITSDKATISYGIKGSIFARCNTAGGDSGSPVIDKYGVAVGTITDRRKDNTAKITPSYKLFQFFSKLSTCEQAEQIVKHFTLEDVNKLMLVRYLKPELDSKYLTNLELVGLFKKLSKFDSFPTKIRGLIKNPVYNAALHRELDEATQLIAHLLPTISMYEDAQLRLKIGLNKFVLEGKDTKPDDFEIAKNRLEVALADRLQSHPDSVRSILCVGKIEKLLDENNDGKPDQPLILGYPEWYRLNISDFPISSSQSCSKEIGDQTLPELFRNHAIANYYLAKLSRNESHPEYLMAANQSAALATLISASKESAASNFALVGDTLFESGSYSVAMKAYGSAWQGGDRSTWLPGNYKAAKILHEKEAGYGSSSVVKPTISSIDPLQSSHLGMMVYNPSSTFAK